jgi:DNA-binding NarL/FixJ family response regulator
MAVGGNEGGSIDLTLSFSADQNGLSYERASIAVVDCHALSRSCLARVFRSEFQEFSILEIESMPQIDTIGGRQIGLVVFNIGCCSIADEGVLQRLADLRRSLTEVPVVLLTQLDEAAISDTMVFEVTRLGVRGYVTDSASIDIALAALRLVIAGGVYFPRSMMMECPSWAPSPSDNILALPPAAIGNVASEIPSIATRTNVAFTERERQVLASLLRGLSNKVIAGELNLSQNTVKSHISRIMHKLHAKNRTEAVVLSQHSGAAPIIADGTLNHGNHRAPLDVRPQNNLSHA